MATWSLRELLFPRIPEIEIPVTLDAPGVRQIKSRQRGNTLREVYLVDGHWVFKRYVIAAGTRLFIRPWIREFKALRSLHGPAIPQMAGIRQRVLPDGRREIISVRSWLVGIHVASPDSGVAREMGRLLARFHNARVVTDDPGLQNFLRLSDGTLTFFDFGKAGEFIPGSPLFLPAIGSELAKLLDITLFNEPTLCQAFVDAYAAERKCGPLARALVRAISAYHRVCRKARHRLQGRPMPTLPRRAAWS